MPKSKCRITDEGRECSKCGAFKPWSEFYHDRSQATGHEPKCRSCAGKNKFRRDCRITDEGRECSKCRTFKPWSEFWRNKDGAHGHEPRCKVCRGHKNVRKPCRITDKGRECTQCRTFKPWSEFYLDKHAPHGHEAKCKTCSPSAYHSTFYHLDCLITDEGRECRGCRTFKPWSEFHSNKNCSHGHASRCKECSRERQDPIPPENEIRITDKGRTCIVCGTFKPWKAFSRHAHGSFKHQARCKDCNYAPTRLPPKRK